MSLASVECFSTSTSAALQTLITYSTLRLRGGKGGFGSKLKAQGARMATKKTTNFESCRDLSGQRLKSIHDAKALEEYIAKEPERIKAKEEKIDRKIKEGLREQEKKRHHFDEEAFEEKAATLMGDISSAVALAVKRPKSSASKKPLAKQRITEW